MDTGYLIIGGVATVVSMLVSNQLKNKFKKYSRIQLQNGLSGRAIAEKMLNDNGIHDVKVQAVQGQLTDHYNPSNKTVNLSEAVYNETNAAAASVAAHECGHAIQHAVGYSWLQMRSKLIPVVNISSKFINWILMIGFVMAAQGSNTLLNIAILLFATTTLFAFITLPVEYDASNRALAWLENEQMVTRKEHAEAKDALKWAARTYLVAALASLANLIYLFLRTRD